MVTTLNEIAELAKLGRKYVKEQSAKNVIAWLGTLPTDDQIDEAIDQIDYDRNWGIEVK